jgi:glutamate mutase epsilon subunit
MEEASAGGGGGVVLENSRRDWRMVDEIVGMYDKHQA